MKTTETKLVETEVIKDVICNKCGESCIPPQLRSITDGNDFYGLIEKTVSGGYYSHALSDCENYTFSLCEVCLKNLFDSFKIPVETKQHI